MTISQEAEEIVIAFPDCVGEERAILHGLIVDALLRERDRAVQCARRAFSEHSPIPPAAVPFVNAIIDAISKGYTRPDPSEEVERLRIPEGIHAAVWECKDYADGWITYFDQQEAFAYQRETGCAMRITCRPARALQSKPEPRDREDGRDG